MRRMCSARCSIEEGDHNEEGKQLNFIQHDAGLLSLLYSTYSVVSSHSPTISAKVPLLTASSAKSKFRRGRLRISFIKQQDCSAVATARIDSRCVTSFSLSATAPADLSVSKRVNKLI